MVIGIDASRANRKHRSGTEWYSFYLVRELAKIDSENQYILYTDEPFGPELLNLCDSSGGEVAFDNEGFQIIKSPYNNFRGKVLKWPFRFLWTQGRLSIEMMFRAPDVLFVPAHTLPIIHPKRSVVTIHDVGFERERNIYSKQGMGPNGKLWRRFIDLAVRSFTRGKYGANTMDYLAWSTLYALKNAKTVITVSNFSKEEIVDVYSQILKPAIFDKIKVVHNGFNNKLYCESLDKSGVAAVLKKYEIEAPYFFYIGRIERKKNIPNLIEGFGLFQQKNSDYNLVLTGAASYGFDEVQYLISEYNLDEKVIKTGWVEENDLPYIFWGATAFVFPSRYEGFGIPLLQAMACGVPVVASDVPAIREVAGDAALLFGPDNIKDISEKLDRIINDGDLRTDLKEKGIKRASQFSWSRCARETLNEILKN